MGNSALSVELERRLADFLGYDDCTSFATGWAAGYGVIKTLVQPHDYIVIDRLAHASLQEGARNATRNVFSVPHLPTPPSPGGWSGCVEIDRVRASWSSRRPSSRWIATCRTSRALSISAAGSAPP